MSTQDKTFKIALALKMGLSIYVLSSIVCPCRTAVSKFGVMYVQPYSSGRRSEVGMVHLMVGSLSFTCFTLLVSLCTG